VVDSGPVIEPTAAVPEEGHFFVFAIEVEHLGAHCIPGNISQEWLWYLGWPRRAELIYRQRFSVATGHNKAIGQNQVHDHLADGVINTMIFKWPIVKLLKSAVDGRLTGDDTPAMEETVCRDPCRDKVRMWLWLQGRHLQQ